MEWARDGTTSTRLRPSCLGPQRRHALPAPLVGGRIRQGRLGRRLALLGGEDGGLDPLELALLLPEGPKRDRSSQAGGDAGLYDPSRLVRTESLRATFGRDFEEFAMRFPRRSRWSLI